MKKAIILTALALIIGCIVYPPYIEKVEGVSYKTWSRPAERRVLTRSGWNWFFNLGIKNKKPSDAFPELTFEIESAYLNASEKGKKEWESIKVKTYSRIRLDILACEALTITVICIFSLVLIRKRRT